MARCVRVLLSLAAVGLLACRDESTAPPGTASTVTVRAYVDADGSTAFSAGDDPVASAPIELASMSAGGPALQSTTDAAGIAAFADVPPGSYTASFDATAPAGAVLATATQLAVTAPFQGGEVTAEFRFVYLPGEIAGLVFRDDNANGLYDPGVDTPGFGTAVSLFAGAAPGPDALAETVTGSDGRFTFERLRPGVHTVVVQPSCPTMSIVDGPIRTFDVLPDAQVNLVVEFTGIPSIAQAKSVPGQVVTVEGVVTVAQGTFRTQNDNIYMQDACSGIQVSNLTTTLGLVVGDSVRVTGLMDEISQEQQIERVDLVTPPTVVKVGTGTVPAPRSLTGAQINARTFEGELAAIAGAVLTAAPTGTTGAYNLTFRDAANVTFTARIETAVATPVPRSFWTPGATYNLTGVLGSFFGTAQLKPRGTADIVRQ